MKQRNIPMFKVAMNPEVNAELLRVLHSGWIGQGPMVREFEGMLSQVFQNDKVLTLSSGTHGLSLALRLCDLGPGDEVITTPLTCTATNMPILGMGADIVWADVKRDLNIDPSSIVRCITDKTKAIIVVHWGGYPCDMEEIHKLSYDTGIPVIEDAAHAYGSVYQHHPIGDCSFSNYTMFSFQAIKHLTSVDGGALCCGYEDDYKRGKLLRWYGIDRESPRTDFRCEEDIAEFGYKFHMNDVCATIGMYNMEIVEENINVASHNAAYYERELANVDGVELIQMADDRQSSYWLFSMLVDRRSEFTHMMGRKGIAVSRVHERNDKHTCFDKYKRELPGLESIMDKMICIPVGWWVTPEDREYIVESIKGGW
jgi:dTDP-4-amino-4,6-dideoxygalactose transaminase